MISLGEGRKKERKIQNHPHLAPYLISGAAESSQQSKTRGKKGDQNEIVKGRVTSGTGGE